MSADALGSWLAPFELFFQKAELRQSLRSLQVEAIAFPYTPPADFDDALRSLCSGIQAYLNNRTPSSQDQQDSTAAGAAESCPDSASTEAAVASVDSENKKERISREVAQSTLTKEQTQQMMDDFVKRQWVEIDANNRDEFLKPEAGRDSTCARTDAKDTNRGVQIQLDIVRNDFDALGRSTLAAPDASSGKDEPGVAVNSKPLEGLSERVENIREHLNVGFVPESADIYRRVSALEDRIMLLEKEFPPWSAEHFNQPGRRYTHPPPTTIYRILPALEPASGKAALVANGSVAAASIVSHPARALSSTITEGSAAASSLKTKAVGGAYVRSTVTSTLAAATAAAASPQAHLGKQPRRYSGSPSARSSSTQKRRRTGQALNSPVDSSGKPIFHSCGRGVNSSLTRSVLAQLQSRKGAAAPADTNATEAPRPSAAPSSASNATGK
ncbi:hypothetical protein H4R99_005466 [Coemansia sp. RSA 1722]|nr:hypothetical protein H4R99_005466 [Coemansia sp. RSA 1722]